MEIKKIINRNDYPIVGRTKADWSENGDEKNVYRIRLDDLHYNEENGRIATWMSTYINDASKKDINTLSREEFNDIVERFIKDSNTPAAFKQLKRDISMKTQLKPGVVLTDGTIVSGNRRFTALRELFRETGDEKFAYFDCFIVDVPSCKQEKEFVKRIEEKTQNGIVTEEDYNPIDKLVSIYRNLVNENTRLWSIAEYCKVFGKTKSFVENLYYRAAIMVDFLEFINKPEQFHIARQMKLDGPINELAAIYKKLYPSRLDEWERIKPFLYSLMMGEGDRTRDVRVFKNFYIKGAPQFETSLAEFYKKQDELEEDIQNNDVIYEEIPDKNGEVTKPVAKLDKGFLNREMHSGKKALAKDKQFRIAADSLNKLGEIEIDMFYYMSEQDKEKLNAELDKIKIKVDSLKTKLNR